MSKNPKFLITRFTHGAGGKFLSSVLQTSKNVDHWNSIIESYKNHCLFTKLVVSYTEQSFPEEPKFHMQKEPIAPYNTDLYSSSYSRGANLTLEEFVDHAHDVGDTKFIHAVEQNKCVNLIMNKPFLPAFCHGSQVVTVTTESASELNWLHRTLWSKHFLEENNNIHYLPDHPLYCNFKNLPTILKYNNPCTFLLSEKNQLIQEKIINNHTCEYYKNRNNFSAIDRDYRVENIFISLESFFNFNEFLARITEIFSQFNLGQPNVNLIQQIHTIWLARQLAYNSATTAV